jgi:uncharacterized membrane protein
MPREQQRWKVNQAWVRHHAQRKAEVEIRERQGCEKAHNYEHEYLSQ